MFTATSSSAKSETPGRIASRGTAATSARRWTIKQAIATRSNVSQSAPKGFSNWIEDGNICPIWFHHNQCHHRDGHDFILAGNTRLQAQHTSISALFERDLFFVVEEEGLQRKSCFRKSEPQNLSNQFNRHFAPGFADRGVRASVRCSYKSMPTCVAVNDTNVRERLLKEADGTFILEFSVRYQPLPNSVFRPDRPNNLNNRWA